MQLRTYLALLASLLVIITGVVICIVVFLFLER
jgi:hypothetical protein